MVYVCRVADSDLDTVFDKMERRDTGTLYIKNRVGIHVGSQIEEGDGESSMFKQSPITFFTPIKFFTPKVSIQTE